MPANISQKGNNHWTVLNRTSLVANNTTPAVAASTSAVTNSTGRVASVYVSGGTVTDISVGGVSTGVTKGLVTVGIGQTIAITYSVAPMWHWFT